MTVLKQTKFLSPNNSKKYVTLYGIYLHALPFMERESERLSIRVPSYNKFSFIVRKYLDEIFKLAIFKHKAIQLPQKLGKIFYKNRDGKLETHVSKCFCTITRH